MEAVGVAHKAEEVDLFVVVVVGCPLIIVFIAAGVSVALWAVPFGRGLPKDAGGQEEEGEGEGEVLERREEMEEDTESLSPPCGAEREREESISITAEMNTNHFT